MSDQVLIPFKAKFILSVNTTAKKFFEDSDSVSLEGELPTHAKAMGWASGFNGCAT